MRAVRPLLALVLAAWGVSGTAPEAGPSVRETFADPLTGAAVWRLTVDGRDAGAINQQGDLSGEASAFAPDSRAVVFAKCCGRHGDGGAGIYVAALPGGETRRLARTAVWNPYPVFARDGSEIYFYDRDGKAPEVKAVAVRTGTTRTLARFPDADWQEKIEVNADGTLLSVHVRRQGVYHTHVLHRDGTPLATWDPSPASGDGAMWNPVHPERLVVRRGEVARAWNVTDLTDTSWRWTCAGCDVAHAAWHPDGELYLIGGAVVNARTGARLGGTGTWPIHPSIHPLDAGRGLDARVLADEAPWFFKGEGRPRLYTPTLRDVMTGDFRRGLIAVHYSAYSKNHAHPHPHWSPDGAYIFFVSDTASDRDGLPPGQRERGHAGSDVFIVPTAGLAQGGAR